MPYTHAEIMKNYMELLETSVGMNPLHAVDDKELSKFQQMSPEKRKIATQDQQAALDIEQSNREHGDDEAYEGNQFSGARKAAIQAGKDSFTVDGKTYSVTGDTNLPEDSVHNQFENPKRTASNQKPNWSTQGTTSQNYSSSARKNWDDYISNESDIEGTTDQNYTADEQHDWDKKGANESADWDNVLDETTNDFINKWDAAN